MTSLLVNKPLFRLPHMTQMTGVYRSYHAAQKPLTRVPFTLMNSVMAKKSHSYYTAGVSWKVKDRFWTLGLAGCAILTCLVAKALNLFSSAQAAEKSAEEIEAEAIAQKDGEIGKCVGRTPDEFGGYIYHYKTDEAFRNLDSFVGTGLEDLGYKLDNGKLSVPDDVALEARSRLAEKKWPHLKPFKIFSYSGDLDDQTSLKTYITHDFNLSDGQGFLRDHLTIVFSIYSMSKNARYHEGRESAREAVRSLIDRLKVSKEYFEQNGKDTHVLSELQTAIRLSVDQMRAQEAFALVFLNVLIPAFVKGILRPACETWHDHYEIQTGKTLPPCEDSELDDIMPTINEGLINSRVKDEDYFDDYFFDKAEDDPSLGYEFLVQLDGEETNQLWQQKYGREFDSRRLSKAWEICAVMDSQ